MRAKPTEENFFKSHSYLIDKEDPAQVEFLRVYASELARYWRAKQELDNDGPTIAGANGVKKAHPLCSFVKSSADTIHRMYGSLTAKLPEEVKKVEKSKLESIMKFG